MTIKRKLFSLKDWLTIPETAKHLTIVFGEDVNEADVLRLALDGHLTLSVYLVNHTQARVGKVVSWKETKWTLFPLSSSLRADNSDAVSNITDFDAIPTDLAKKILELSQAEREKLYPLPAHLKIDEHRFLNLDADVISISGVWDLPMIGGEALDIEHEYLNLTNGPSVTLSNIEGAFLQRDLITIAQLQESFDDNEYHAGSKAQLEKIKLKIAFDNLPEDEAHSLLKKHKADREKYLKKRRENPNNDYYPAEGLPNDAVLVVRTDELRRFEYAMSEDNEREKPLNTTERNTLLTIIAAMCKYEGIDPSDRKTTSKIVQMTEDLGAPVSDDTVRAILKKIPNAVDTRKR